MPATRIVCDSSSDGEYASTRQGTSDVTDFRKRNGGKETIREGTVLSFVQEACMYNNVVPFLVNIDDFHRLYLSVWNANTYARLFLRILVQQCSENQSSSNIVYNNFVHNHSTYSRMALDRFYPTNFMDR